jgi:RNAse (barnase) inhibitor barstar
LQSNYKANDATVEVIRENRNGTEVPTTIVFKDGSGSKDQYRCMSKEIVDQLIKVAKFKGANWKVTVQPTVQKVAQLSEVAGIYAGIEPTFAVKVENGDLIFSVGNTDGGIMGRRAFASDVTGSLDSVWSWNLTTVLSILKLGLTGTCIMKFGEGVCQIDIDSGIGLYSYILPAFTK